MATVKRKWSRSFYALSAVAFYFLAFLRTQIYLPNGIKMSTSAMIVIGPAIGRVMKMEGSPDDSNNDCLNVGSAIGPSTMANTAGASG